MDFLTSDKLYGLIQGAYVIAGICFIVALAGLSKHETARRGNQAGIIGMAIALVATILLALRQQEVAHQAERALAVVGSDENLGRGVWITLLLILVPIAIGAVIGAQKAKTVEMTGMPELIALLHSFVGLAAVLVGFNTY